MEKKSLGLSFNTTECRTQIWNAIHKFSMKLLCLSPAEFIHFGMTRELRNLVTKDVLDYEFLDWKMQVNSTVLEDGFAAHNAYVGSKAKVGIESDCFGTIQNVIYAEAEKKLPDSAGYKIAKDQVEIALPG